jgi:hypothetical protein
LKNRMGSLLLAFVARHTATRNVRPSTTSIV